MGDFIYSLARFFHEKNPNFPCVVAGGIVSKSDKEFELHSQGFRLPCERSLKQSRQMSDLHSGDWVQAKIVKTGGKYELKTWKKLQGKFEPDKKINSAVSVQKNWEDFLTSVKNFFSRRGMILVKTPTLVESPGTEPHLLPFQVEQILPNKKKQIRFLPTSPEMHLKKLLCRGWTDIFEIKKCFRNGELSPSHQPEFYMLEWYRAFFSLKQLIGEVEAFLEHLSREDFFTGSLKPMEIQTVSDLFFKHLNFPLTPETDQRSLVQLLNKHQIPCSSSGTWEECFHLLFLNKIEPYLCEESPLIVRDYPICLRGFSRLNRGGWADRFELYWRGFELANAFYEVINPLEQERLFQSHLRQRADSIPADGELLQLMKTRGMPPCSGIALGLDRLFAALCGEKDISFKKI